jgi:beta-xylosidase
MYCTNDGFPNWGSTTFSVYTSDDLANWEEHPVPILDLDDVPWWRHKGGAWAPTIVRNDAGDYVFYFVADSQIGAAISSSPYGPFEPLPNPLLTTEEFGEGMIDPSVFIDDDGTKYLLWGNTVAHMARLTSDCLDIDRSTHAKWQPTDFREALWIHRRGDLYYASWSANDARDPEYQVRYAISDSLTGPWQDRGILIEKDEEKGVLATGHHSITRLPGMDEWILAYHRFSMCGRGSGHEREIVFAPLSHDANGNLQVDAVWPGSYMRQL